MSDAFVYRPKFVDIRVKPGAAAGKRARSAQAEPSQRRCDQVGCERPGAHRAPKGRDHGDTFWNFCTEHVSEYNKRWNYFSGMSDAEVNAYMAREEVGQRPTWTFRGGRLDRAAAARAASSGGKRADPFNLFGNAGAAEPAAPVTRRRLSRTQGMALEVLQLPEDADAVQIRTRYAELVKRWHPDSNGGDRTAEANLHRVLAAYQTLKAAGLV